MARSNPTRLALVLGFIMAGSYLLQYSMVHAWSETFAPPRESYQDDLDKANAILDKYSRDDQMEEGRANDPEETQRTQKVAFAWDAFEQGRNRCKTTNSSQDCDKVNALAHQFYKAAYELGGGNSTSDSTILALVGGSAQVSIIKWTIIGSLVSVTVILVVLYMTGNFSALDKKRSQVAKQAGGQKTNTGNSNPGNTAASGNATAAASTASSDPVGDATFSDLNSSGETDVDPPATSIGSSGGPPNTGTASAGPKSTIGGGKARSKKAASNTGAAGSRSAGPATGSSGGPPTTGTASTGPKSSTGSKPSSKTGPK